MREFTASERQDLIADIASRAGKAREIAQWHGLTVGDLHTFVETNKVALELARAELEATTETSESDTVTPTQLDELWISKKFERLYRYQIIAEYLFDGLRNDIDQIALREFRAYLRAAAEELGQLLHRGSGDAGSGDTVNYSIEGIDPSLLR